MAVSKIWKVTVRLAQVIDYATDPEKTAADNFTPEQYQALADVLQYAKDEEKTEREFYVDGINCNVATARDQFVTVKAQFGKPDGIQAYHGYLSFKEEDISPDLAQKIGMEFANRVWGKRFQVVVTTHMNTKHLHCHFVVNSVSFVDGKRLANEEKAWFKFRHIADELCQQYKLYYNPNPVRGMSNSYYYNLRKAGMPDRYDRTRSAIDDAISKSRSIAEFKYVLDQIGYRYELSESLKYWTVIPKGWKKPIRMYRLGDDYTNDRIKERLRENRDKVYLEPYQKQTYRPRQYNLATREHRIRKKGGLYGLYLHYCYKLGYLPKYKQPNPARLHYLLREDLYKVDQLSAQVRLLGRENISTSEQLFLYKSKAEDEIKRLVADRTHLRNEIRKVNIDDDSLSTAKLKISAISDRLSELRRDIRLCNAIAERSGVMQETLATVLAEEEKSKRKENRNYEQRR